MIAGFNKFDLLYLFERKSDFTDHKLLPPSDTKYTLLKKIDIPRNCYLTYKHIISLCKYKVNI